MIPNDPFFFMTEFVVAVACAISPAGPPDSVIVTAFDLGLATNHVNATAVVNDMTVANETSVSLGQPDRRDQLNEGECQLKRCGPDPSPAPE